MLRLSVRVEQEPVAATDFAELVVEVTRDEIVDDPILLDKTAEDVTALELDGDELREFDANIDPEFVDVTEDAINVDETDPVGEDVSVIDPVTELDNWLADGAPGIVEVAGLAEEATKLDEREVIDRPGSAGADVADEILAVDLVGLMERRLVRLKELAPLELGVEVALSS
jgi:hypothetical protein